MNDQIVSYIRTGSPIAGGMLIAFLSVRGIKLDSASADGLVIFLTGLLTGLYYLAARLLEQYVHPRFGWLLGAPKQPIYSAPVSPAAADTATPAK